MAERDKPWMMRTYSGHSTAKASNELYRTNLAKGQTGLSIAFDLPTQTGYDPDDPHARGEVGKVGVPVAHLGHMEQLLDGIPVDEMNTSMTINATAAWLLGLYVANAEQHGVESKLLRGTTQNDIVKEDLSRGTYIFPPRPSRRLIVDMVAFCAEHVPLWNPINGCSYHLQEALGVTLSKDARARSIQLPAWNEALGLQRPWDQQWSLRIQQVLAYETDLLEYDDLFAGSHVVETKTAELADAATAELDDVLA